MKAHTKAHAAVIGANILFAINFSMVKAVTPGLMSSYALNVVRIVGSVIFFWLLYVLRPSKAGIHKKDISRFALCGLSGVAVNQVLFIKGLSLTSTIHGSLLVLGTPIFITLAAAWLLHEAFTRNKIIGLSLGIAGALVLVLGRTQQQEGSQPLLGDVLIILNSISYALYFVWVRPLMEKYHPIHVIRWVFTFGMFMILPFGLYDFLHTPFSSFPVQGFVAMSFVVIGGTFVPYLFNTYGLKYLGPGITGAYIYTQPLFAACIGMLFLGEQMGWQQMLAAVLIAAGVLLVNRK